jgi:hypothetical protein
MNVNLLLSSLVLAFAVALPAQAQDKSGEHVPPPGFDPRKIRPLTERKDLLSWKLLSRVELVRKKDRYVPRFSGDVAALDKKQVKLQGFMYPLQTGGLQTHFLLWSMPQTCAFCMPGGPENTVEVRSKQPVKYTFEPVVLSGRFEVLKEEPTGIFYRLSDAVQSD